MARAFLKRRPDTNLGFWRHLGRGSGGIYFAAPAGMATHLGLMRSSARPPARPRVWLMLCAVLGPGATAQSVVSEVRLGGLFQHTAAKVGRFVAFVMAVHEINNSSALLPHTSLR